MSFTSKFKQISKQKSSLTNDPFAILTDDDSPSPPPKSSTVGKLRKIIKKKESTTPKTPTPAEDDDDDAYSFNTTPLRKRTAEEPRQPAFVPKYNRALGLCGKDEPYHLPKAKWDEYEKRWKDKTDPAKKKTAKAVLNR